MKEPRYAARPVDRVKRGGGVYLYYVLKHKRGRNPQGESYTTSDRVSIGRVLDNDPGYILINDKFKTYFPKEKTYSKKQMEEMGIDVTINTKPKGRPK
ncbi:hypothetical protein [Psittacicella hinzii]|uniref:Uncharacterized protein n=1 Tax=Psittacicella hinzii TaxID=2028575 RepID=A0A3A1YEJ6_9GAMM|nr:hypothetical protein [Psittacicella hinzii]RIY35856.1 hypothetical protein CKF58_06420 [Psittacicella hinzii]